MKSNKTIKWLAFGLRDKDCGTNIHFFPYSGSISATYPVDLSISVFGQDIETVNVTMEGARLAQPDGLTVEKIFPALLDDYKGFYGIEIELSCQQENVDLNPSICFVEFRMKDSVITYNPKFVDIADNSILMDLYESSDKSKMSIVAVNYSNANQPSGFQPGSISAGRKGANTLAPYSVNEYEFSKDYIQAGDKQSVTSGQIHFQRVAIKPPSSQVAFFKLERKINGNQAVRISSI